MAVVRWLIIFAVLFVLIIFGVQNMEVIPLKFKFLNLISYQDEMPLFFVVVSAVFSGAALAGLIGLVDHIRIRNRMRKQRKAVERLENEVKTLRNLPLEDEGGENVGVVPTT